LTRQLHISAKSLRYANWRRPLRQFFCLAMLLLVPAISPVQANNDANGMAELLRVKLAVAEQSREWQTLDWARLGKFYEPRDYRPVWIDGDAPNRRAELWRDTLRLAGVEGLNPQDYHLAAIENHWLGSNKASLASLELLLTDAFIRYSVHVRAGRLAPEEVDPDWHIKPAVVNGVPLAWLTLAAKDFANAVSTLPPTHVGYRRLRAALARYRQLEEDGGWPILPPGPDLRLGDRQRQVGLLRIRLMAEDDLLPRAIDDVYTFDTRMSEAVKRFQARHGLDADGVVGEATRAAMNVPVSSRIEQIRLNMERWRWLPRELGERYIMVNTADYRLEAIENDQPVLSLRVITGEKDKMTPVLSANLDVVQFNPYWVVPEEIAAEELLPSQQRNAGYFSAKGYRVFDKWGEDAIELDPLTIDWSIYNKSNFHYKIRQDPGPKNALGRMKFIFRNAFAIYLHDTPHRRLFNEKQRAFSHGCVRVQNPTELALYLLKGDEQWDQETVRETIAAGETVDARMPEPVPIYLVYWTAWVGDVDQVNFREDVYEKDQRMAKKAQK
jgi:murein L,D-transpeptidase YcbB/YkuD